MKYVLNDYYTIRHDIKRTFILGGVNGKISNGVPVDIKWKSIIHPAYAMMLAFFSKPIELSDAIDSISAFFNFSKNRVATLLNHMIHAEECWHTDMDGFNSGFPRNLIIPSNSCTSLGKIYDVTDFKFTELDSQSIRMISAPISIVWMPNNNCYTQCEYCYADRSNRNCNFSLDSIRSFVENAKSCGVLEILLTGGDLFVNPHWVEILNVLKQYGYNVDMVSTKKALSKHELEIFKTYGIRLQVSLDSITEETVRNLLHVNLGYPKKMCEMLENIKLLNIDFQVATVLTKLNNSLMNLERLLSFFNSLEISLKWEIRVAFRSLYTKTDFDEIKSSREQISKISDWISSKKGSSMVQISWSPDDEDKYRKTIGGSRYFEGPKCTANLSNLVVLPDGQATICEQLYWNPDFIIGNVFENTITDIWNSTKALSIYNVKQESIKSSSPCRTCKVFVDCFKAGNRCYANILKAYGRECADYPDPRCNLAPPFKNSIGHE